MISRPIKIPELVSDRHSFQNQHKTGARKGSPMPGPVVNLTLFFLFINVFSVFLFFCIFRPFFYVMRVCTRLAPGREVQWPMWSCQPVSICICVFVFCICNFLFCISVLRTSRGLAPEREVQWPVKLSICRYLFHRRLNIATTAPKLTSPQIKLD